MLEYLRRFGFFKKSDDKLFLSEESLKFLETKKHEIIYNMLNSAVLGFDDILSWLYKNALTLEEIYKRLIKKYDLDWKTNTKVLFRLNWLRSIGYVEKRGRNYILTKQGEKVVEEIIPERERIERPITIKPKLIHPEKKDIVGEPIYFREFVYAPLNEAGVILLFSKIMGELGFIYEATPSRGVDLIARRRRPDGTYERVRIEFEYKSSNFRLHGHRPEDCDIIVCWKHDWPECPVEVIELKKVVEEMKRRGG